VINKKAATDCRAGMNFNTCKPARQLHDKAGDKLQTSLPQRICNPVCQHHLKTRIQEHRCQLVTRSRVARTDGVQITVQLCEHHSVPFKAWNTNRQIQIQPGKCLPAVYRI
jgi:hypothetical protein